MNRRQNEEGNFDVLIVGAGCAGLMTADFLSELGAKVRLIEQGDQIAPGPSTRNGGYVHGGGFHAAVIDDPTRALTTARRCREGRDFYWTHHWSAIYFDAAPVRLIVRDAARAQLAAERWASAGISATLLSSKETAAANFEFSGEISLAAHVNDLPINYTLVYQKILNRLLQRGVVLSTKCRLSAADGGMATIDGPDGREYISAKQIVYCSGFDTKMLVEQNRARWPGMGDKSVKIWKSHVLLTRRFTQYGYMIVDPGEVSVMPQGDYCVVCQSQDDEEIEEPNYEVVPSTVAQMQRRLNETYNVHEHAVFKSNACLKPSLHIGIEGPRSVDIHVLQLSETEILALPGKATEAPLMAAEVVAKLQHMLTSSIAKRPGETYLW
jgi:glycine/D-amino acid oxidase-like deaminating enzyme